MHHRVGKSVSPDSWSFCSYNTKTHRQKTPVNFLILSAASKVLFLLALVEGYKAAFIWYNGIRVDPVAFVDSKKNVEYHQTKPLIFFFIPIKCISRKVNNTVQFTKIILYVCKGVFPFSIISRPTDMTFELSLWVLPGLSTDLICADTCNSLWLVSNLDLHPLSDSSSQVLALREIKLEMKMGC